MRRKAFRLPGVGVAALVLLLSACGASAADGPGLSNPAIPDEVDAAATATSAVVNPPASGGERREMPLDAYLDVGGWQDPVELARQEEIINSRREELIAQCMRDLGFQYIPDTTRNRFGLSTDLPPPGTFPDDADWVAQYGYGVAAGMWVIRIFFNEEGGPNAEHLETLSDSEREAWQDALFGDFTPPFTGDFTQAQWREWMLTGRGCHGWASQTSQDESPALVRNTEEFEGLFEEVNRINAEFVLDPELIAANRDWASCLADAGFPGFTNQNEPRLQLQLEEADLQSEALFGDLANDKELQDILHAELREREIPLAVADLECRVATDFQNRIDSVRYQLELVFIENWLPELTLFRERVTELLAKQESNIG